MDGEQVVLVQFRAPREVREWFKDAAHAERMTLSAWLRRLAISRAGQVTPQTRPPQG